MNKISRLKNSITSHFQITVVGGGLTGSLMIYLLIKSKIVSQKDLCWIRSETDISHDFRVSFYNKQNYDNLNKIGLFKNLNKSDLNIIKNIEVLNEKQNKPLKFKEENGLGYILKNIQIQSLLLKKSKNISIINSKVVKSSSNAFEREISLENGTKITSNLVLAADGRNSYLRKLSSIKYLYRSLNHTALTGYLYIENSDKVTARQVFVKEGAIGLLPVKYNQPLINFVWSINTKLLKTFDNDELIKVFLVDKLNNLYKDSQIKFKLVNNKNQKNLSQVYKWPLELIYVPKPFSNRLVLIGDSAHTIHPLAGQGFNLSLEDCLEMIKILKNSLNKGQEFGHYDNLLSYSQKRKIRTASMVFSTTSIFYSFTNQSEIIKKILSLVMERIENTKFKNIFKLIASG